MTNKKAKSVIARCLRRVLGMSWGESHKYASMYAKSWYDIRNVKEWEDWETAGRVIIYLTRFESCDFSKFGVTTDSKLVESYSDPCEIIIDVKVFKDGELLFSDWC